MRIGIFAKTFAVTGAQPVLSAVRAAGYQTAQFNFACVGLPSMPDKIHAETAQSIAQASTATGIAIVAISGTYNMIHPELSVRQNGARSLAHIIASARAMGTGLVTLCTGTLDPDDQWRAHPDNRSPKAWQDLRAEMAAALTVAETAGVDLGIEPELANVVSSATLARKLIDELKSPRLKVVLDAANLFERAPPAEVAATVERAVDLLADRIVMAHAKDRRADGAFCAAGNGVIDFAHFVRCLRRAGFGGPLVTHGLSEAEAPAVAKFLHAIVQL